MYNNGILQILFMKIFDTHTHDYFSAFDEDRNAMMQQDLLAGVFAKVQIGCDEKTSKAALLLALEYDFCFSTVGLHPCNALEGRESENYESEISQHCTQEAESFEELMLVFERMIQENPQKIVGVGETGFDFFHQDFPELRQMQEKSFLAHCILAQKYNKTLVIHTRNARTETLEFLHNNKHHLPQKAIVHCFSEDSAFAREIVQEYGYFLGIGGIATYKKSESIREAIKQTPLEFLVTETDAPFLAPQSVRGKRNQSAYIPEIIQCIAEIKNIDVTECEEVLFENAKRVFGGIFAPM